MPFDQEQRVGGGLSNGGIGIGQQTRQRGRQRGCPFSSTQGLGSGLANLDIGIRQSRHQFPFGFSSCDGE